MTTTLQERLRQQIEECQAAFEFCAGLITPVGLLMRAFGKDPMRLKTEAGAESYWIDREPLPQGGDHMKNQF